MMDITVENRRAAWRDIKPKAEPRQNLILDQLAAHPAGMTAEEMTAALLRSGAIRFYDLNFARPRLTELAQAGKIEPAGKARSERTGRTITIWQIKED